jgi:hypothetical protein
MVVPSEDEGHDLDLRLLLESDVHGREYFDGYDSMKELLEGFKRLVQRACQQTLVDGVGRVVAIEIKGQGPD